MKPILVHVQHLFGSGHVRRICALADALADHGFRVVLVSGGLAHPEPSRPSISLVELPSVGAGNGLGDLVDTQGNPVDESLWRQRADLVRKTVLETGPGLIITEGYPFARRRFARELTALIRTAKQDLATPATVACSVRDIIQPKSRTDREDEIVRILNEQYDYIFIHGEADFVPLDVSFPKMGNIRSRIVYTGYVDAGPPIKRPAEKCPGDILVSAGGGIAGRRIYETSIRAASLSPDGSGWTWRILVGNAIGETDFSTWRRMAPENATVERNRPDFRQLLAECGVSVSQIGYNTAVDLVLSGTRGIVIPYEADGEKEQMIRASSLERLNHVRVLREADLDTETLTDAVARLMKSKAEPVPPFSPDGTERFLREVDKLCRPQG
ncbi:MAG: hypothetical protein F4Z15_05510 [Gammaproteobacteria bacterium]|nr:hypothetical protein [Gammaproteobacteria bacterium]MYD75419.1 hypothetical protein [Gammaproteobacteria bacterium]MYJ51721.1 hypothetical protein [Gammaproteobacteria bacterium]